jgi:hypothetical protein
LSLFTAHTWFLSGSGTIFPQAERLVLIYTRVQKG